MAKKPVRNLVVVSDTHCGCKLALHPREYSRLDDGGRYAPSEFQLGMLAYWEMFWKEWVPTVTRGEPYDIVHNGDAIEGVHHRASTPISHNEMDQGRIAATMLGPIVKRAQKMGGRYFHVRGTEAHVGESAKYEEMLAKELGAVPSSAGQYARWDLWKRVGERCLVHLLHHIGTTGSAAHEASAVNAELTAEYVEAARWQREPPDFVVRSHRHRSIAVDLNSAKGYAAGIVTPAWQGKTPFAYKIPGARVSEPQFGGIVIREGDEEFFYRRKVWSVDRSATE
jgi:hypothetical protein